MLVIRKRQMEIMNARLIRRYEEGEAHRLAGRFPEAWATLGPAAGKQLVHDSIEKAVGCGIYAEADISVFLDLTFRFGRAFEDRAEFAWAGEILHDDELRGDAKIGLMLARLRARGEWE